MASSQMLTNHKPQPTEPMTIYKQQTFAAKNSIKENLYEIGTVPFLNQHP